MKERIDEETSRVKPVRRSFSRLSFWFMDLQSAHKVMRVMPLSFDRHPRVLKQISRDLFTQRVQGGDPSALGVILLIVGMLFIHNAFDCPTDESEDKLVTRIDHGKER
jgi:hypothetical protein